MIQISDPTGRFSERPFYENYELDDRAERLIIEFMNKQHGKLVFPVPTDDLVKLIERDTADLDSYADLSHEGHGVQGVTDFIPSKKPKVRIAAELWEDRTGHRLRTTLTHEYGHVDLHTPLFDAKNAQASLDLFPSCCDAQKCHRGSMIRAQKCDWLEWQAGYMSGALLMPANHVCAMLDRIARAREHYDAAVHGTPHAVALVNSIADAYDVSKEAARVRLIQLGRLVRSHHQNEQMQF